MSKQYKEVVYLTVPRDYYGNILLDDDGIDQWIKFTDDLLENKYQVYPTPVPVEGEDTLRVYFDDPVTGIMWKNPIYNGRGF